MTLPAYDPLVFKNAPDLTRLQGRIGEALRRILKVPLLDGVMVPAVSIGTSPTLISHGLDRAWVGWVLVDVSAPCRIFRPSVANVPATILNLQSDVPVTASVWVF